MKKTLLLIAATILAFNGISQTWDEVIKAVASHRASGDFFGYSLSIDGNRAIVGAYGDDDGAAVVTGAAYIFEHDGSNWVQSAKLVASDRNGADRFGFSVDISGDKIIVGAPKEDEDATGGNSLYAPGSAYIFEYNGTSWTQTAKLVASDRADFDEFGYSVSISNDNAIVGAYLEDEDTSGGNTFTSAGSAYIFEKNGGNWTETAKLVASNRSTYDEFGHSVSISGDQAIVGAYRESTASGSAYSQAGVAYIFKKGTNGWSQTARLIASDHSSTDLFGYSVCIEGTRAIVGARLEDHNTIGFGYRFSAGSAYIFDYDGSSWSETAKLVASDRDVDDEFGTSVSISGDRAIVGAPLEDEDVSGGNTQAEAGSAYIFKYDGSSWTQTAKLVASDRETEDEFGRCVSISEDQVIVGAPFEDQDATGGNFQHKAGSVYAFNFNCPTSPPSGDTLQSFCDAGFVSDLALTGSNIKWYGTSDGGSSLDGSTPLTDGTYYYASQDGGACESQTRLEVKVKINPLPSNLVTSSGGTLTADETGATYQWLDCDNGNSAVDGAINQSYTSDISGQFAVEVSKDGCTDTSDCYTVEGVGIIENSFGNSLQVFPNPTGGHFSVNLGQTYSELSVSIKDINGKVVYTEKFTNRQALDLELNEPAGMYFLEIRTEDKNAIIRIVKE